jgi:hypothetical protein
MDVCKHGNEYRASIMLQYLNINVFNRDENACHDNISLIQVIGQIAALTTGQSPGKSSLELEILHFVKFLVVVSLVMATAVFLVGSIINHWQNEMHYIIYGFLTIIIANVPNGKKVSLFGRSPFERMWVVVSVD